jgi:putative hydrolase of the HAD superfamily
MFPDVAETLRALEEMGIRIGVISNWDSRLESILDGIGLGRRLDVVVISSLVGYSKPHPRIFEIALERSGMGPEEAVHVGDTFRDDVQGAQAAGIRAVLLQRSGSIGMASRYLLVGRPSPDCTTVASLTELPALLANGRG